MSDPENGNAQIVVRRRRTRRHRRNRSIRRLLFLSVLALLTAGASTFALRYLDSSFFSRQEQVPTLDPALTRDRTAKLDQTLSQMTPSRPIYPYSVVPGGVEDAKELKWVAEHDPVVAAHYAGFDYYHARVVRLTLARTAYVSYRIGNHIYWMRRRITLHKGEKLITDGRITARSRCANRVEEKPQQAAASPEPAPEQFEKPVEGAGSAMQSPAVPFESALLNRPPVDGLEPTAPLSSYSPFGGGGLVAISPPPLLASGCAPTPVKKNDATTASGGTTNGKKKIGPCGTGVSSPVPEPATWLMLICGLAAISWLLRRKFSRA